MITLSNSDHCFICGQPVRSLRHGYGRHLPDGICMEQEHDKDFSAELAAVGNDTGRSETEAARGVLGVNFSQIAHIASQRAGRYWDDNYMTRGRERYVTDRVAADVLMAAVALIKDRADTENHVVAPGMWFAAGWLRKYVGISFPWLAEYEPSTEVSSTPAASAAQK